LKDWIQFRIWVSIICEFNGCLSKCPNILVDRDNEVVDDPFMENILGCPKKMEIGRRKKN
jgi:hypothetical protein